MATCFLYSKRCFLYGVSQGLIGNDGSRWFKMVQDGSRWFKMVQDGSRWFKMVQDGRTSKMVRDGRTSLEIA